MCKVNEAGKIEGYVVRFGDKDNRDLQGEYFTPETKFEITPTPALYIQDTGLGLRLLIGEVLSHSVDEVGVCFEAELDDLEWKDTLVELVTNKTLHGVSIGINQVSPSGEITEARIAGIMLTPTPANPCPDNESEDDAL